LSDVPKCKNECYELTNNNNQCEAQDSGYFCSRLPGHKGDHVACGVEHEMHVWGNE